MRNFVKHLFQSVSASREIQQKTGFRVQSLLFVFINFHLFLAEKANYETKLKKVERVTPHKNKT